MLSHRCEAPQACCNVGGNAWLADERGTNWRPQLGAARREHCMRWSALMCAGALVAVGCAPAGGQVFHSSAGDFVVQTTAKGLAHPWALAFLPDCRMLTAVRPWPMRIIAQDGTLSPALAGVPKVFASGQGSLLHPVLDRRFAQNHNIYFFYAEPEHGG